MSKKKLIEELKNLNVNDTSFKESEERVITELRMLYKENPELFSDEEIKEIKCIDNIKELAEDIEYCKSKESIDQIISDFHSHISEIKRNEFLSQKIQTYIRLCLEKKHSLPSEKLANEQRKEIQSFGPSPHCPKCEKLMVLRDSSFGHFWGCVDFPTCWGKKRTSSKGK